MWHVGYRFWWGEIEGRRRLGIAGRKGEGNNMIES